MSKLFVKKTVQPMEPWTPETDMTGVNVSVTDQDPKEGDHIATNQSNPNDRWLVSKEFIEANYEEVKTENVGFGEAINALKQGKRVSRQGWNGKGMFIFERPSDELTTEFIIEKVKSIPDSVKAFFKAKDANEMPSEQGLTRVKFGAYLCMYAADGSIVNGWLASQTDILAEDWCILD